MRFRILGPLSVEVAGAPLRIRSARVSTLLATLLLEANRTVPTERLVEAVWGWHAPPTARAQLRIVVSQLRGLLDQAGVERPVVFTETAGYRLAATSHELDALLFEQHVAEAERVASAGRPAEAVGRFRSALELWRGPALAGVPGQLVGTAATLLTERRAAVRARCIELELALGRHADLLAELVGLAVADPFNERFRENLVLALYRSGRVTEALAAYQEFRQRLADEVGIEPSPRLAALHRRILNRDPALDLPATTPDLSGAAAALPVAPGADPALVPLPVPVPVPGGTQAVPGDPSATAVDPVGTEPNRPGRRPGGPPARRRLAGRPGRRPGGTPSRRPGGQPGGPARRRPSGRDGTPGQPADCTGDTSGPTGTLPPRPAPTVTTPPVAATRAGTAPPVAATSVTTPPVATARPGTAAAARATAVPTPSAAAPAVTGSPVVRAYLLGAAAVGQSDGELPATPWQLPPAVADFVGRQAELTRIRRALGDGTGRTGPAVVVLSGLPGIGKTALAVRAGWDVGPAHPDGCLYAQLVDDRGVPVDPYEVLGAFLCALGVPEGSIPVGRTERRDRYRSVVARRRILVLLDGAVDEVQVRPLLPTGPASAALVTARRPLAGLDGAHPVALDALPVEPAVRLLTGMLPERVASDLSAAHRLVELCDRLPSAIRVTGSRLAVRADRSLAQAVERLTDGARRLDRLADGDRDVRRGLAGVYQRLAAYPATLLRRLGTLPVAEFPGWLAVPLLDTDRSTAEQALADLTDTGLLRPAPDPRPGLPRYRMPELVRLYAGERVSLDDPPPTRATAHRRAYWWLLDLALRADRQVPDHVFPAGALGLPEGFGPDDDLLRAVDADPLGWLGAERHLVVGAAEHAAALGDTELAWRLAVAPTNFLHQRGLTELWQRAVEHGRAALRGRGVADRAQALLSLGNALLLLSRAESAAAWTAARTARRLFDELGDPDRAAACATVQWLAGQRPGPAAHPAGERVGARRGTDESAPLRRTGTLRGVIRRIGVAPRATPILCPADQPEPLPRRPAGGLPAPRRASAQRPPEVVVVFPGQVLPPDPALSRGE
ncbi:BTAD domain-containing putative transcriptional regulator [Plantactinospora sp. KLBMP9567]|uniref:AfsR/SARP family transcriptional regulator n=1 Tax=Plantactinospora sp. KLBMP9567 TaxID=3085900 RepID=UPI00298176FD|nr:BTAD domain-containing putative transcriptional regulator [Plantactinospora sp. KLBMP9567]MDW5330083.1 BTAD domain-containing putative transcriptional regulator [Plantactinospora sp. KLBMP9567]